MKWVIGQILDDNAHTDQSGNAMGNLVAPEFDGSCFELFLNPFSFAYLKVQRKRCGGDRQGKSQNDPVYQLSWDCLGPQP